MQTTPSPAGLAPAAVAKTPRQILVEARELISEPSRWTFGHYARAANGNPIGVHTPGACSFCILGAIAKASGEDPNYFEQVGVNSPGVEAVSAFEAVVHVWPPEFNDDSAHDEVVAAFDKAIASLPEAA